MRSSRRDLGKMVVGGVLLSSALTRGAVSHAAVKGVASTPKLGVVAPFAPSNDDLRFLQQIGVEYVYAAAPKLCSTQELLAVKKRYADAGITLHNVRWFSGAPSGGTTHLANILLNLPGRDDSIEQSKQWLRNYGAAGFDYTIATLSITGVWSSSSWSRRVSRNGAALTRGGVTREFDQYSPDVQGGGHTPDVGAGVDSVLYGRVYGEDELLENYRYFCRQIAPVAEEHGVRIGFHPDDPPTYTSLGGVARINGTFEQIKRNIEIANSPNIGIVFCAGVWLAGGERMGMNVLDAIRYFVPLKKVWEFNFRNVSATVPRFLETYMDNGYYDLYEIMRVMVETGYDGIVHQDHRVEMVGGSYAYDAFSIGYMKGLLQAAVNEKRRS